MKQTRKLMIALLAGSLLSTISTTSIFASEPTAAATAVKTAADALAEQPLPQVVQESLDKLYSLVPELKDFTIMNKHSENGLWVIFLSKNPNPDKTAEGEIASAIVMINGNTGALFNFNIHDPLWASDKNPAPFAAKEKAEVFLTSVIGEDQVKNYKMSDFVESGGMTSVDKNGNRASYSEAVVSFLRMVKGIALTNSGYRIGVNEAGHVVSFYNLNREQIDESKFPDAAKLITQEEAEKAYVASVNLKLVYDEAQPTAYTWNGPVGIHPVLKYMPLGLQPIDARTGQPVQAGMDFNERTKTVNVSPLGKVLVAKSAKEAAELLMNEFGVDVTGYKLEEEKHGMKEREATMYQWRKDDRGNAGYSVQTTSEGRVMQIGSIFGEEAESIKETVTKDEAQNIALEAAEKYLPTDVKQVQMSCFEQGAIPGWVDKNKLPTMPHFLFVTFTELNNGIPVSSRATSVEVDLTTGKVRNIFLRGGDVKASLPDSRNIVTKEQAAAAYLNKYPLTLQYMWPEFMGQKAPAPVLVYAPATRYNGEYIDALTGQVIEVGHE
ncbi:YcdB/YcdC domain-containing protein [Aneurinibacillus terranovensis]|uniref:YcdB/YcdC domain-containing protein n=1 Tax=Aneurinibacillus terranovensis TaxID=278991 RepID=UPI000426C9C1|nr:YcdB/YcdC domain-containing protein [Aneurinibacillus terranovensis]